MFANINLHPIIIHFPIALLSLYAGLEIISFRIVKKKVPGLFITKAILVCVGGITLLIARQTGSITAHQVQDSALRPVIRQHEQFANYSTMVFGIIAAAYVLEVAKRWFKSKIFYKQFESFWKVVFHIQYIITETFLIKVLASIGFVFLLITGALGGILVYGPNTDPIAKLVNQIFFK